MPGLSCQVHGHTAIVILAETAVQCLSVLRRLAAGGQGYIYHNLSQLGRAAALWVRS